MSRKVGLCFAIAILVSFSTAIFASPKPIDISVVSDGRSEWNAKVIHELKKNLNDIGGSEFTFRFPTSLQYNSNWSQEESLKAIRQGLNDKRIDIVLALGVISSNAVAASSNPKKPLIASAVINAKKQGFPVGMTGSSGVDNLHYLASNIDITSEISRFQAVTGAKHIGILVDAAIGKAIPSIRQGIGTITSESHYKVSPIAVQNTSDVVALVNGIPRDIDALFLLPLTRLSDAQHLELGQELIKRKLPTYTTMGRAAVEFGYLMGTGLVPSPAHLARQLAIDIRDIALGRQAGSLPVSFSVKDRLTLNLSTARAIGFEPSFSLLFESETINERPPEGRVLSLTSTVSEALRNNLSIAVAVEDYHLAEDDSRIARSSLLPQISAGLEWSAKDRDLVGTGATHSTTAQITLSQSIYSESNRSNFTSSKHFERAQAASLTATQLDVIQDTAKAYLNVLVARTERDIRRDNVKLTRANLERATYRNSVGATDRSEVYRFETELGSALQSLSSAQSNYQTFTYSLNQALNRPIDESFQIQEPSLNEPGIFGDARLEKFLDSPKQVAIFRDFLVKESLESAPELMALEHQISAQKRMLIAAERKRYVPDVDLVGSVNRVLDDHGGKVDIDHDEDWSLGVQLSLPLYQGSRITSEKSQARTNLRRLRLLHKQSTVAIEVGARNSVARAGSSRMNIDFARSSAEAAEKTLALVTDSYVRGSANYIDLIDAQNSQLTARLSASSAEYQNLLDLIDLQRAIGFFDFYVNSEQKEAWFQGLNEYAQSYGIRK